MITKLLKIRLFQLFRELKNAGLFAGIISLLIYSGIVIRILKESEMPPDRMQMAGLFALGILMLHLNRKDKNFLKITGISSFQLFFWEYLLFSLPFIIPFLFTGKWYLFFVLSAWFLMISSIDFTISRNSYTFKIWFKSLIPSQNFEWIAGMRRYQYSIFIIYILAFFLGFWHYSAFICVGILTFCFSGFYNECESRNILCLTDLKSKGFIMEKLKKHVFLFLKLLSPLILFYACMYPAEIYIFLLLLITYIANYIVFILNKYKSFVPDTRLSSNQFLVSFLFLGIFLPYLFPVSLVLIFIFYRKAVLTLNFYLS